MKKYTFIIFLILFSFQKANSQKTEYFSATLNASLITDSPVFFLNPVVEYNYPKFGFYIGPIISEKVRFDMLITKNIKHTITISGIVAGGKYTIKDSLCNNKISFNMSLNCGLMKYNYKGITDFNWGGTWSDGPFNNTYSSIFLILSPGITFKINKKLFSTFQMGPGIEYNEIKYNYISSNSTNIERVFILSSQIGISYKFLK